MYLDLLDLLLLHQFYLLLSCWSALFVAVRVSFDSSLEVRGSEIDKVKELLGLERRKGYDILRT